MAGRGSVYIVRTGTANVASVCAAIERLGARAVVTEDPELVGGCDRLVLPGVGTLAAAMERLDELALVEPLRRRIRAGQPTLAVCLGMQMLCGGSAESPGVEGLGILEAEATGFPRAVRVPQLGWNDVAAADVAPTLARLRRVRAGTPLRCLDRRAEALMVAAVDAAAAVGTTLGGVAEVVAFGVPAGLGTYVQPDRRLDARLAGALAGIPSVKAAEIGDGAAVAARDGRSAHDELFPDGRGGARRETNRAGGLEGGVTNGEPVRVRAHVKPISTQREGLRSVELRTGKPRRASWVRSDTCVVAAAGVVAEAVVAWELACELTAVLGDVPLPDLKSRLRELRNRQERT